MIYTCIFGATCIVSTWVGAYSWSVSTHTTLVPRSCTLYQSVLIVSTSDEKYIFGVPFKVLTKQVSSASIHVHTHSGVHL